MSAAQDNDHHHYHYCKKLVWSPQWEGALHSINHTLVADPPPPLQLHCFDFPFLQTHAPHIIIICLTTRITRHYRILCARPEEYTSSVYLPTAKLAWIRQFKVSITPPAPHCKCTLFKLFSDATLMGNCDANSAQKNNVHAKGQLEEKWKTEKIKEMVPRKSNHQKRVTQVKRTFALTTFTFFSWNHQLHFCSSSRKVSVQAQKWNRKQNARSIRVDNADDVYSGSLHHVHHYFISFSLFQSLAPLRKCTQRRLIKEQERKRK